MNRINIRKGDSFTIGIKFSEEYLTENVISISIESTFSQLDKYSLQLLNGVYRMEFPSSLTSSLPSMTGFCIVVEDSIYGIKKTQNYQVYITGSSTIPPKPNTNDGLDAIITIRPFFKTSEIDEQLYATLKGEKGDRGKSAYEVAVDNGFVGTESEWLESLRAKYKQETFTNANNVILNFNLVYTPRLNNETVYLNGQRISRGIDYNISSNIITFLEAPLVGDVIDVEYYYY